MKTASPWHFLLFILGLWGAVFSAATGVDQSGGSLEKMGINIPSVRYLVGNPSPVQPSIPAAIVQADSAANAFEPEPDAVAFESLRVKPVNIDSLIAAEQYIRRIEFKDSNSNSLHSFFESLLVAATHGTACHVFHFGDSQIETDRITGYLRHRLQQRFGGSGMGLLSLAADATGPSIAATRTSNWRRFALIDPASASLETDDFGALCAFSDFTPQGADSLSASNTPKLATVHFRFGKALYPSGRSFRQARLFYGPTASPVRCIAGTDSSRYLMGQQGVNVELLLFDEPQLELQLSLMGSKSPAFFGIEFGDRSGVGVTNVPLRGSSGTVFHKTDRAVLQAMLAELNTTLILLQFGGNVLPYVKSEKECADYGRWFQNQLSLLKHLRPEASILVIGPADMSVKVETEYETYPLLTHVRDALKQAAFNTGVGYWDMYEAMGGRNSMPLWVAANPPLAGTDYTHFTPRGARTMAEFFYRALIYEFELYRHQVP